MPKSYRIRTTPGTEKTINIQLEQDFEFLEILSLKINQGDIYNRMCSDYGVIIGRVLVNNGYGVPNARVSVFIPINDIDIDNPIISEIYPYKSLSDINDDGYRYNLLPKKPSYTGHAATGTFPTKEEILTNQSYVEVYDKYYRFSVKTNDSGDYMIFGVPNGTQTIVMDVDLSDIGCFSLSPQDLVDSGIAVDSQVNGSKYKTSSNLNELPQIITLNKIIEVSPLWGEAEICLLGITRADFDLTVSSNITIKPNAVFMGSLISTTDDDAVRTNSCKPKNNTGNLCELISGPGQILTIRQTINIDSNGRPILETHELNEDGKVIDAEGTFLVNLPMNLNYITTNEFGEQVLSNDPKKGIPTKGKYRFKFKWQNEQGLQNSFLRGHYLVPNIKEHGWISSASDPLINYPTTTHIFTLSSGTLIQIFSLSNSTPGGLVLNYKINVESFTILVNGAPYFGDLESIPITTASTTITINVVPINPGTLTEFNYTFYQQPTFNALRSYAFSLDWNDYGDNTMIQEAINCEDRFYEFNYNKVYTTAMFLDRYKKGAGRARHLGIKEIDNRTCKSTVNTFPVNDVIRNFDFLFFTFNLLLNILAIPILVLLFLAHFVAWAWPVLKYLLIVLGIYFAYVAIQQGVDLANSILEGTTGFAIPGGPVVNAGVILRIAAQAISIIVKLALSIAFIYFTIKYLIKIKNFPRIGLPMLSYPECTSCDCDCGSAELDDDIDENSVNASIQEQQSGLNDDLVTYSQSTSFLAPVNLSSSYNATHPNLNQYLGEDVDDHTKGYFYYKTLAPQLYRVEYRSLIFSVSDQIIAGNVVVQAVIDFRRLFSGYDAISSSSDANAFEKLHAPQEFLFAADDMDSTNNQRWVGKPSSQTYPQKLNQFNLRDKYFKDVNIVLVTVNPQLSLPPYNSLQPTFTDQILVVLAKPGTLAQLGIGELVTFQDPNFMDHSSGYSRRINLTGATNNEFDNNAITGTTIVSPNPFSVPLSYVNNIGVIQNIFINIIQSGDTPTQTSKPDYLKYPTDIEYFQIITGMTVSNFKSMAKFTDFDSSDPTVSTRFPANYLRHKIVYKISDPEFVSGPHLSNPFVNNYDNTYVHFPPPIVDGNTYNILGNDNDKKIRGNEFDCLDSLSDGENYEILMFVRGVDPHTKKQNITYNVSKILGWPTYFHEVTGMYYLNQPITNTGQSPENHYFNTTNGNPAAKVFFPSFTFTPTIGNYTAFTSTLNYYYLCTDVSNPIFNTYSPESTSTTVYPFQNKSSLISSPNILNTQYTNLFINPTIGGLFADNNYIGGGSFFADNSAQLLAQEGTFYVQLNDNYNYLGGDGGFFNALYSQAYFLYNLSTTFSSSSRLIMRSSRLPTSTCIEDAPGQRTAYALHQNNKFCYYKPGEGIGSEQNNNFESLYDVSENLDQFSGNTGLTQTLTCDGLIALDCYSGSGINVGVIPANQCLIPEGRVTKGCYCLLNKKYITEYGDDAKLFMEWKVRFTLVFAACRGVFAQTFQNNWINGTLYMPSFNKVSIYPISTLTNISSPNYEYCKDIVVYNNISNNFYYRSSPWNQGLLSFIGKKISHPTSWFILKPGYNDKNILFPTTILDMGPRDSYISEICNNPNFKGHISDQFRSTSYNDNSDIIQIGFLSRILNENFRQVLIPITVGGNNSEGKGITQFFNSTRGGDRIDGDFAQSLSINSEFKINPFIDENYGNSNIFIGDDGQSPSPSRSVFGVFYNSNNIEYSYRRNLTPGIKIYNISPLLQDSYGYPNTQYVPHYKWRLAVSTVIFGQENNNWQTSVPIFANGYQDLDYSVNPYFNTSNMTAGNPLPFVPQGFITNFDLSSGAPDASVPQNNNDILVGAPSYFYFGLNNGSTAMSRFIKKYIDTADI